MAGGSYILLVVDDEPDMYTITRLTLKNLQYNGRGIVIEKALSGGEAVDFMQKHPETAVILMDVVMESQHAGLEACQTIRNELQNRNSRIILRTGQPGIAPERSIIEDYEIDGYLAKSELTKNRLFTAVRTALKAYCDLTTIQELEAILTSLHHSAAALYTSDTFFEILEGILESLQKIAPSDIAILYLDLEREIEGKEQYIHFKGTGYLDSQEEKAIFESVFQQVQALNEVRQVRESQALGEGCLIPLILPRDLGQGWIYTACPVAENPSALKALDLLAIHAVNALYNALLRQEE